MLAGCAPQRFADVAPYTGAWIEMQTIGAFRTAANVAPYTGAWIEIRSIFVTRPRAPSRSLHGSVD
ncbi:hypothetical protein [Caproicibacterium sp. XB2]|uniref:hypothetical protein n=1 Tax=Caproicibacterium sp. XB2 TaxID=3388458 RepID=UPI003850F7D1